MKHIYRWFLFVLVLTLATATGQAQEEPASQRVERLEQEVRALREQLTALRSASDSTALAELRRQIEAITREIEGMRLGEEIVAEPEGRFGFGPAASKVYRVAQGVSIGGYGEIVYENFAGERQDGVAAGRTDQLDALRAIVYVGYKFSDKIIFNSEIEFEHGSTDQAGSVSLEFGYLDFLLGDDFGVRAGLLLLPMGFVNELHEPPTFLGTKRPEVESRIIPSTWREVGVGVFGSLGAADYRIYLVSGLDAVGGGTSGASGFSASGLRGGRQKGSKAVAEDFAIVGRLDYPALRGLTVGSSVYLGNSGQSNPDPTSVGDQIGARTVIWEGHAEYRDRGIEVRGLFALADVADVAAVNAARGLTGDASIGSRLVGGYLQAGYDVLWTSRSDHQLLPYVRYERINTQDDVPAGFSADPSNNRTIVSIGAAWKPIMNVVVKSDYQIHTNDGDTGVNQFTLALGYLF